MSYFVPTAGDFDTEILDPSNLRYWKILVDTDDDDILDDITTLVRDNRVSGGQGKGYAGAQWTVELYNYDGSIQEGDYAGALAQIQFKVASEAYITIFTGYVSNKGAERKKNTLSDDVVRLTFWDLTKTKATKRKTPQGIYAGFDIVDTASEATSLFHVLAGFLGLVTANLDVASVDHAVTLLALKEDASAWKELQLMAAQYLADMYIRYDGKLRFKTRFETGWSNPTSEWDFYTQGASINVHSWRGYLRPKTATRVKSSFKLYEDKGAIRVYKNTDDWNSTTEENEIVVAAGDYWPGPDADSVAQLMYRDPDTGDDYDFATGIVTPTIGTGGSKDIVCSGGTLTLTSFNGSTSDTQQNANSSEIILQNATGGPITITRFQIRATNAYLLLSTNDVKRTATVDADEDHVDETLPGKYISDYDQAGESCEYLTDWAGVDREVYEIKTDLLPQIQKGALVTLNIVEESRSVSAYIESFRHVSDGPIGKAYTSIVLIKYLSFTYDGTNRIVAHRSYGTNRAYVDSTVHFDEDTGLDTIEAGNVLHVDGGVSVDAGGTLTAGDLALDGTNETLILGTGNDLIALDAVDATYRLAIGHATYASAPFRVGKDGALTATAGTIGGWTLATGSLSTTNVTIDATNERMYLGANDELQADAGKARWSVFDNLGNEKVAIGYFDDTLTDPDGNPYTTSDYGLYVAGGNKVFIQVQMDLDGADLVQRDGSISITEAIGAGGDTLLKIGTESAVVGYHLYDASGALKSSMHLDGDDLNITSGVAMASTLDVTGETNLAANVTARGVTTLGSHVAQLGLFDTTAVGADIGGFLLFGGKYTGSTYTEWAGIQAPKENATDGQYGGELAFFTRPHGSVMAERVRIDASGNVGIGTSSPIGNLSIGDTNAIITMGATGSANTDIRIGRAQANNYHVTGSLAGDLTIRPEAEQSIVFGTINVAAAVGTERMRIDASGNVGIGTSSPGKDLDVVGTLRARDSGTTTQLQMRDTRLLIAYGGDLTIQTGDSNGDIVLSPHGTGNVEIGTSLTVASTGMFGTPNASETLLGMSVNTAGHEGVSLHHDGTEAFLQSVDAGSVWQDLTVNALNFRVDPKGAGDALIINTSGVSINTGWNLLLNHDGSSHTNEDVSIYFASDAYILWDESEDYFNTPDKGIKANKNLTDSYTVSGVSYNTTANTPWVMANIKHALVGLLVYNVNWLVYDYAVFRVERSALAGWSWNRIEGSINVDLVIGATYLGLKSQTGTGGGSQTMWATFNGYYD